VLQYDRSFTGGRTEGTAAVATPGQARPRPSRRAAGDGILVVIVGVVVVGVGVGGVGVGVGAGPTGCATSVVWSTLCTIQYFISELIPEKLSQRSVNLIKLQYFISLAIFTPIAQFIKIILGIEVR
jgi:hypothetical protein